MYGVVRGGWGDPTPYSIGRKREVTQKVASRFFRGNRSSYNRRMNYRALTDAVSRDRSPSFSV